MTTSLTPSEIVLLHGERFTKPSKDGFKLPSGTDVDSGPLSYAAAQAAILANQQAGAFVVEPGTEKRFFGLFTSKVIRLRPGATQPSWPKGTLEERVREIAANPKDPQGVTLGALFVGLIPSLDYAPWSELLGWVEKGLVARGLAENTTEVRKTLGIFKHEKHSIILTEAGKAEAARHPVSIVDDLLASMDPQIKKSVQAALDSREETRDPGGSSFD